MTQIVQPETGTAAWQSRPVFMVSLDRVIGDQAVSYLDPEFLEDQRLVVWQDGQQHQVWLCQFDADTGELIPSDGRGITLGQGAKLITPTTPFWDMAFNGPEFGVSSRGVGIYFCGGLDSQTYELRRYDLATETSEVLAPAYTFGCRAIFPTATGPAESGRVMFMQATGNSVETLVRTRGWFDEATPNVVEDFPIAWLGRSWSRWMLNERAILTNLEDDAGVLHAVRFDIDTRQPEFITSGPLDHYDASAFAAAEYPGETLVVTTTAGKWLDVFRRRNGGWQTLRRIAPPSLGGNRLPTADIASPETAIYRGKTYLAYVDEIDYLRSRIVLATLDGRLNAYVSAPSDRKHYDPEVVVSGDKLFVYYYEGDNTGGNTILHRCEIRIWP